MLECVDFLGKAELMGLEICCIKTKLVLHKCYSKETLDVNDLYCLKNGGKIIKRIISGVNITYNKKIGETPLNFSADRFEDLKLAGCGFEVITKMIQDGTLNKWIKKKVFGLIPDKRFNFLDLLQNIHNSLEIIENVAAIETGSKNEINFLLDFFECLRISFLKKINKYEIAESYDPDLT